MTDPIYRPSPWLLIPAAMALAILAYAHRDPLFSSICLLCLGGSYFHSWQAPKRYPFLVALLGFAALCLFCLLYYRIWLLDGESLTYFRRFRYKPWLVSTGIMLQAVVLTWTWHSSRRSTGPIFLCMGLIAMSCGNLLPSSYGIVNLYALLGGACLLSLFVLSGAMNGGRDQPFREQFRQSLVVLTCIAIISAGTWYVSTGLQYTGQLLDTLLADLTSGSRYQNTIGAGDSIRVAHQRHVRPSQRVVATLSGRQSPLYLRTQVLTDYQQHRWTISPAAPQRLIGPDRNPQTPMIDHPHGPPASGPDAGAPRREVRLHVDLGGAMPLPYNAASFHPSKPLSCLLTAGAIVQCTPSSQITSYTFESSKTSLPIPFGIGFALPSPDTETSSDLEQSLRHALAGPEAILAQLRPMARQIAGEDATHTLAAAQHIQNHFRQHFTYSLRVNLDPDLDPIVDFVRHRRPAYCEYFASGMVLMLRALGVPARVVGGFLVWEYNELLQQWIVRQRDAHAWVEVYDDQGQRWVGFDATPSLRQAQASHTGLLGWLNQGHTWIALQLRSIAKRLYPTDFIAWFIRLRQIKTGFGRLGQSLMIAVLIAAAYGLCRRFYRSIDSFLKQLRWPVRHRSSPASDPVQAEAQDYFARVARLLKQHGLPILPTETLEDYLQRMQSRDMFDPAGPRWAQPEPTSLDPVHPTWLDRATWPDPAFIDAITHFSHAYHQCRFRPSPSGLDNQAISLQQSLIRIRYVMAQMQQMQIDSVPTQQSC